MKQSWALNKTVIDNQTRFIDIPRKTSTDYLFEYGGKITNDTTLLVEAEETLMKVRRTGGNPIALASGALYHACKNRKLKVSKDQIGEAFKISHRTVYTNEARIRTLLKCMNIQKTYSASNQERQLLTVEQRKR